MPPVSSQMRRLVARAMVFAALSVCLSAQAPPGRAPESSYFDSAALMADLATLSSDAMEGREIGTTGGQRARAYLASRFRAQGLTSLSEQAVAPSARGRGGPRVEGANLIARITGTTRPDRFIVVSAHYDHVGVRGGRVFNGANDNASGAAALPAIAGYFQRHRPATSLLIVAFDGEEAGLLGSRAFLRAPPVAAGNILINLNADMIGRDPANTLYVAGTFQQSRLKPFVERVAARAPVRLKMGYDDPSQGPQKDWTRDSDHYAFTEAGIPALYIGVEDFDHLHSADDDFETMTPGFYVRAVETIIELIREFDAGAQTLSR